MVRYIRRKYLVMGKIRDGNKNYYLLNRHKTFETAEREALNIEKRFGRGTVAVLIGGDWRHKFYATYVTSPVLKKLRRL